MLYVGLDIHSKHITLCVLSEKGELVRRAQARGIEQMLGILKALPDRFEVCYEVSCGYGHSHDLLHPLAARVVVAHPGQLRLIFRSRNKNDRNDAERLAKLLYLGEVPAMHVPTPDVRAWRELINCRSQVIAKRTRAKNSARALLRCVGVVAPKHPGLWTKQGLAWLRRLALPTPSQQLRRDLLVEEIETLTRQLRRIEQELNRRGSASPAVAQLRSIPGVGPRTAEAVAAFVDDPPSVWPRQGGRPVFRARPASGPVGGEESARAHHARRRASRPPARRRGRLAGGAPLADGPRVLRAFPAWRPAAEEDCAGRHGALPGARDVGAAEARDRVAGEGGPGRVAPTRARRDGSTRRGCRGTRSLPTSPEGERHSSAINPLSSKGRGFVAKECLASRPPDRWERMAC